MQNKTRCGKRWTQEDDAILITLFSNTDCSLKNIATLLKRTESAILTRFVKSLVVAHPNATFTDILIRKTFILSEIDMEELRWQYNREIGTIISEEIYDEAREQDIPVLEQPKTARFFSIYVLRLDSEKYYVGKTSNDPTMRIQDHMEGRGCEWTRKYTPLVCIKIYDNCSAFDEDKYTKEYMAEYGIDNVRGGTYCRFEITPEQRSFIEKEILGAQDKCYNCGEEGHFVRHCKKNKTVEVPVVDDTNSCINKIVRNPFTEFPIFEGLNNFQRHTISLNLSLVESVTKVGSERCTVDMASGKTHYLDISHKDLMELLNRPTRK